MIGRFWSPGIAKRGFSQFWQCQDSESTWPSLRVPFETKSTTKLSTVSLNIEPKSNQFHWKPSKARKTLWNIRITYEELANKRVARVLPSGRGALQEGGAQISRPAAWRSCPNICLHTACGDPQAVRTPPPLSTLSPSACPCKLPKSTVDIIACQSCYSSYVELVHTIHSTHTWLIGTHT